MDGNKKSPVALERQDRAKIKKMNLINTGIFNQAFSHGKPFDYEKGHERFAGQMKAVYRLMFGGKKGYAHD